VRYGSRFSTTRWRGLVAGVAFGASLAGCGTAPTDAIKSGTQQIAADSPASTLLRVADAARSAGDLATAVSLYQRATEATPQDPTPWARLGAALTDARAYTEAAEAYQRALKLAPGDPDIERGLGTILADTGRPGLAISHFEAALKRRGDDPKLYNALGVARDLAGRHDLAQEAYRKGLALAPGHLGLLNNLGLSQALAEDFPGAIGTLSKLVAMPAATARHRQNLALVYGLAGEDEKAAVVARLDLEEAAVKNNLAYYALLRGMSHEARVAAIVGGRQPASADGVPARK
jgi:Flp pilus assembly protein TadD